MLLLWTTFFTVVLSLFVFVFNVVLLFAIATTPKLHTFSNALASNLWIANTMSAAVTLFQNLLTSSVSTSSTSSYVAELGPQTLVALFNSTVSLLALLAMASVQIMARYQTWLPRSAPMRISVSIWVVVVITVFVNFALMQITKSFALIIAFQLALLSIFLVINLILHPINLLLASRVNQDPQLSKSITQSLWLLLHSLSFTLLAMMLVWESSNSQQQPNFAKESQASSIENIQLLSLQLAAYSVHCIANPLITVIRDPHLAHAIGRIIYGKGSRNELDYSYSLCQAHESVPYVYLPEHWLLGHIPPPPPYMSQSNSIIVEQAEVI